MKSSLTGCPAPVRPSPMAKLGHRTTRQLDPWPLGSVRDSFNGGFLGLSLSGEGARPAGGDSCAGAGALRFSSVWPTRIDFPIPLHQESFSGAHRYSQTTVCASKAKQVQTVWQPWDGQLSRRFKFIIRRSFPASQIDRASLCRPHRGEGRKPVLNLKRNFCLPDVQVADCIGKVGKRSGLCPGEEKQHNNKEMSSIRLELLGLKRENERKKAGHSAFLWQRVVLGLPDMAQSCPRGCTRIDLVRGQSWS